MRKKIITMLSLMAIILLLFPMQAQAAETSGACGENVYWNYDEKSGTLIISGNGAMDDYWYTYAFPNEAPWIAYRKSIKSILVTDGITHIGNNAFSYFEQKHQYENLVSVTIPDTVTSIGERAFAECSKLEEISLPINLDTIGSKAFAYCTSLLFMDIPESVSSIGGGTFEGCSNLESIKLPSELTVIESRLFKYCKMLQEIVIPDGVTRIMEYAFNECHSLTSVIIPDGVMEIGNYAFSCCDRLKEVVIPNSVVSIGSNAFSSCAFAKIDIPDSVNSIGDSAFAHCNNIKSIYIPNGVTSIGKHAFSWCSSLVAIYIPRSVTTIGQSVFLGSDNLKEIFYEGLEAEWNTTGFNETNAGWADIKIHFVSSEFNVDYEDEFDFGFDNLSFYNNYPFFFTSDEQKQGEWDKTINKISKVLPIKNAVDTDFCYQISDEAFQRLIAGMSNTVAEKVSEARSGFWGGSCYGMVAVAAIRYIDKERLPISQIDDTLQNEDVTYSLKAPVLSTDTENLINYYQLMQFLPLKAELEERNRKHIQSNYSKTVEQIAETVQAGTPVLVCITNSDESSRHAVLLLEVTGDFEEYYTFSVYEPGADFPYSMNLYKTPGESTNYIRIEYLGYNKIYSFQTSVYELDMRNYFGFDDNATFSDYDRAILYTNSSMDVQLSGGNIYLNYQNGQIVDAENVSGPFYIYLENAEDASSQEVYFTIDYANVPTDEMMCTVKSSDGSPCELEMILQDWSLSVASEPNVSIAIDSKKETAEIYADSAGFISLRTTQDATGDKWPWHTMAVDLEDVTNVTISHLDDGIEIISDGLKNVEIAVKNDKHVLLEDVSSDETQIMLTENDGSIEITDTTTQVKPISGYSRLAGGHRYETAFLAADQMKTALGVEKFDVVVVASGANFADALSGSYLAAVKNAPILLACDVDWVNDTVKDYINANLNEGGTVYILGGESAVPASMETGLDGFTVKRLAGSSRFDTNLAILEEAGVGDKPILVCTGLSFADSLSASAAKLPILLVWNDLTEGQKALLDGLNGNKLYIIGGESAVGKGMEEQLTAYGEVERVAGGNRFETSVAIAETFFSEPKSAVLAYAWNFPDGLCGGPLAATMDAPLLLTMDNYEAKAAEYIQTRNVQSGIILGGEGLISEATVNNIFQ